MRLRRRVVVAGVVVACAAGAAAVAGLPFGDAGRTPARPTAEAAPVRPGDGAVPAAAPASADSGLGSRASGGGAPPGAGVTLRARPPAEVAEGSPASVAYLRDRYRIDTDEAVRRLALQELSAPLAASLASRFPAAYGGMWLDQAAGGVLTVAATTVEPVRAAVADLPDAAHVRVVPARHPLRQLTEAATRLAATLDATAGADVVVDERANEVVVLTGDRIRADEPRLADALRAAGVPARARARIAGSVVQKACDPRDCPQAPMRGGIRLDVPRDDGTVGGCTTGFNVIVGVRTPYVLTAGHCVVGGRHQLVDRTWHQFLGPKVPVTVESTKPRLAENAYPYDYAVMPYQPGAIGRWAYPVGATQVPSLVNYWCVPDNPRCATRGSGDVAVTGHVPWSAIQPGWVVCATGAAYTPKAGEQYVDSGAGAGYLPGTRCGEIIGKASGGIDVRICARPGDSGGPLFTEADGKALGILSHGDPGQGACTNPNERNSYAPVSTILDRANALTDGGLRIRLATKGPVSGPVPR
ncbi:streptogrisin C [Micromonospora citrea]|uniref:Streptogrisin C n=1 Tax=Micromonospora citrea TaxID=47855 RepID=A0A1C6VGT6_9ACTN|nr:trypsin-like serine protease [Micromonospora citrea]SCL65407.1 streptogrisin C [Micromonospora citrea]